MHGVMIWAASAFTGRSFSNLSMTELEYTNTNCLAPAELHQTLRAWGAVEALVMSHGANSARRGKWPAIACINTATLAARTNEPTFVFRLYFAGEASANRVLIAYLGAIGGIPDGSLHARTVKLKPVINTEWSMTSEVMVRPSSRAELNEITRRLFLFGMKPEITPREVERKIRELGFTDVHVRIRHGRVTPIVEMKDDESAGRLLSTHGPV